MIGRAPASDVPISAAAGVSKDPVQHREPSAPKRVVRDRAKPEVGEGREGLDDSPTHRMHAAIATEVAFGRDVEGRAGPHALHDCSDVAFGHGAKVLEHFAPVRLLELRHFHPSVGPREVDRLPQVAEHPALPSPAARAFRPARSLRAVDRHARIATLRPG